MSKNQLFSIHKYMSSRAWSKKRKKKRKQEIKEFIEQAPTTSACMQTHLTYSQNPEKKKELIPLLPQIFL